MRVFCIGDSITFGMGDRESLGWVHRLPMIDDVQYFNLGVPGHTLNDILERAFHEISARKVPYHESLIIIGGSLNDLCQDEKGAMRTEPEILKAQLDALIGAMQKLAPTLVLGPPPILEDFNPYFVSALGQNMIFKNAFIEMADQAYAEIAQSHGAPYMSLYTALKVDPSYLGSLEDGDGIHPDETGYLGISDYLNNWKALRSRLPE